MDYFNLPRDGMLYSSVTNPRHYKESFSDPFDPRLDMYEDYQETTQTIANKTKQKQEPDNLKLREYVKTKQVKQEPVGQQESIDTQQFSQMGKQIYAYLTDTYQFTPIMAVGALKVMRRESGLNPTATNGAEKKKYGGYNYGFGLCQWTGTRQKQLRDWAQQNNRDVSDWRTQVDFFVQDANKRTAFMSAFKQSASIQDAVDLMTRGYENGTTSSLASVDQMNEIYNKAYARLNLGTYDYTNHLNKTLRLPI